MTDEKEVVRSVFGAYINDLKVYSTKPDRPTFKMLEKVRDKAIKALEQTRWIPVSELPKKSGEYLLDSEDFGIFVGDYDADMESFGQWREDYDYDTLACVDREFIKFEGILAWRELPQSYKAESEDKE